MQKLWTGLGISELDVALQRVIELTYKGLFTAHALNWNWFDRAIHGAFIGRARQRHVSGVIRFDWLSKIGTVSARLVFNTCIPMRPAVNAAVRELEFNSLHMVWTSVNCVNVKTRQDKTMSVDGLRYILYARIYRTRVPFYTITYKLVDLQFLLVLS